MSFKTEELNIDEWSQDTQIINTTENNLQVHVNVVTSKCDNNAIKLEVKQEFVEVSTKDIEENLQIDKMPPHLEVDVKIENCDIFTCGTTIEQLNKPKVLINIENGDPLAIKNFKKLKNFQCEFCFKNYSHKETLKLHIKSVHEGFKKHKCDLCDKTFVQVSHQKEHIKRVHEGVKNNKCDICDKAFITHHELKRHINSVPVSYTHLTLPTTPYV